MRVTERFTKPANDYSRYRPDYPPALIDWLASQMPPGARVVDLGAGTGIVTRLFRARGLDVLGVEPNAAMRQKAEAEDPGGRYLDGTAERIPVEDGGADAVVVGQAFHWFDVDGALCELARVIAPGGWIAAFWNVRDRRDSACQAYQAALDRFCPRYASLRHAEETLADLSAHPRARVLGAFETPHAQRLDWPGFWGRVCSSSYVAHDVADRSGLERAMRAIFDRYAEEGELCLRYVCTCVRFTARAVA